MNQLQDNVDTIEENTEALTGASKVVGPVVNTKKMKYMLLSRHQNDIKRANSRSTENVAQFK
jgi:hypothetical protein